MEALLIGLRIMALLTFARWLTPSTVTLSSLAKGLGTLTIAYAPIHTLVFWLLQESGSVATCLAGAIGSSVIAFVIVLGVKRLVGEYDRGGGLGRGRHLTNAPVALRGQTGCFDIPADRSSQAKQLTTACLTKEALNQ